MNVVLKKILGLGLAATSLFGCMDDSKPSSSAVSAIAISSFSVANAEINTQRAAEVLGLTPVTTAGNATGNCARCHGDFKSNDGLTELVDSTYEAYQCLKADSSTDAGKLRALGCLAALNPTLSSNDIFNANRGDATAIAKGIRGLKPAQLGFFTAAVTLQPFADLFSGNNAAFTSLYKETWAKTVAMPKGGAALNINDFQIALTWLINESPEKEKFLVHNGPVVCSTEAETFVGSAVKAHISQMSLEGEGWNFKNQANGLKMFACDARNANCFQSTAGGRDVFPLVSNLLIKDGQVRKLHTLDDDSTYWTRSSADGRYVSYGSSPFSQIVDLSPKLVGNAAHKISIEADYDPSFTPDNLSFMYQGDSHGSRFCHQNILANSNLNRINFNDQNCSTSDLRIGLYQGIGSSLENGDIMTIAGGFKSDEGATLIQDATPFFPESSSIDISRIRQSESNVFEKISTVRIATPYIANWMLSPSQKLAVGTVSAATAQKTARHGGYRIVLTDADMIANRRLPPNWKDQNTAMLCVGSGEKPQFSFDERYLVYYAYEKHSSLVRKLESSANLFVIDLLGDGKPVQITSVPKGTYAQFPHFRSDGWLYFSYYNSSTGTRDVLATDAVLKLQN